MEKLVPHIDMVLGTLHVDSSQLADADADAAAVVLVVDVDVVVVAAPAVVGPVVVALDNNIGIGGGNPSFSLKK